MKEFEEAFAAADDGSVAPFAPPPKPRCPPCVSRRVLAGAAAGFPSPPRRIPPTERRGIRRLASWCSRTTRSSRLT